MRIDINLRQTPVHLAYLLANHHYPYRIAQALQTRQLTAAFPNHSLFILQNPFTDQLILLWPSLHRLLQAVRSHRLLQLPLLALNSWRCTRAGQDVLRNEIVLFWSFGKTLHKHMNINMSNIPLACMHTFFKLSVIFCRSNSACLACRAGAAVVSRRMCLSCHTKTISTSFLMSSLGYLAHTLRSCSSGRCCKCFSKLFLRSRGLMGAVSMPDS